MKLRLTELRSADERAYDAFLTGSEHSLLYYSSRYKSLLQDLLRCEAQYWLAWDADRVVGVLPIMWRDGPHGRVLNSLPYYGSNGGALAASSEAAIALTEKYNELASAPDVAAATWVSNPLQPPSTVPVHSLVDERIGQFTALDWDKSDVAGALHGAIEGSARRNVRKAQATGVTVHIANNRLDFIQSVHVDNMAEIGGKAKSAGFFSMLPHHFAAGSDYRVYLAERDGRPISGLLLFYFNRTVEYFTPVTVSSEREFQPMALILEHAMTDAAREGYLRWNWGGTWLSQDGVWRFKHKWGAKDRRYRYYTQLNAKELLHEAKEDLLAAYPDFYVIPFSELAASG